jgi:hypothetical protein
MWVVNYYHLIFSHQNLFIERVLKFFAKLITFKAKFIVQVKKSFIKTKTKNQFK